MQEAGGWQPKLAPGVAPSHLLTARCPASRHLPPRLPACSERQIGTVTWPEVAHRLVRVSRALLCLQAPGHPRWLVHRQVPA